MDINMKNKLLLGAICSCLFSAGANAAMITNGSFETGDFTGWVSTGTGNNVTPNEGSTDGIYAASFNGGEVVGNGVLSQSFTTVIGNTYLLDFDYGVFSAPNIAIPNTQNLRVELIGDSTLLSQILTDTGSNPNVFTTYSFGFTADSISTTLSFTDLTTLSQSASTDFVIDNISVSPVPVPAAAWLFASGLLGLISIAKRKKA